MKRKISQADELNLEEIVELPSKKKKKSGHVEVLNKNNARGIKRNTLDDPVSPHHTQTHVACDTLTQLKDNRETPSKKKKKTKKVTTGDISLKQTLSSVSLELKTSLNNNGKTPTKKKEKTKKFTTDEVSPKQTQSSVSLELKTSLENSGETSSRKNKKTKNITPNEISPQQTLQVLSPDTKKQLENSGDTKVKRKKKTKRVTQETPDEVSPTQAQPCESLETKTQLENKDETPNKKKSKKKSQAGPGGAEHLLKGTKNQKNPKETEGEARQQSQAEDKGTRVVQYLRQWHADRSSWKFSKLLQVRLFHLMYNTSVIPDEDFSLLLLYLEGLQGNGREKTKQDAKKILDEEEIKESADPDRESRARQIYQLLD